jgi:hypothetical protein
MTHSTPVSGRVDPPFVTQFIIKKLKNPSILRADPETLSVRDTPLGFDRLDLQPVSLPKEGDRPLSVRVPGMALD